MDLNIYIHIYTQPHQNIYFGGLFLERKGAMLQQLPIVTIIMLRQQQQQCQRE